MASVWRSSRRDSLLVALAGLQAAAIVAFPAAPVIALGVWWNSNTIAHNFVHRAFFRSQRANLAFSAFLSVLVGVPQALWRDRHLAHHAGVRWGLRVSCQLAVESGLVLFLWVALALEQPRFFALAYLPGYLGGLVLCAMQGYWEHAAGSPVSHYGPIYNWLCFNDGFHAEHHANPSIHWSALSSRIESSASISRWPPLLRWLEVRPLELLEQLVLRTRWMQSWVLRCHRRAFRQLLPQLGDIRRVTIVGGGLFPRTALLLRELAPGASLTILDANPGHLETARPFLKGDAEYRHERYVQGTPLAADLAVLPLCFEGDRAAVYVDPPASALLVHDWVWRRRGAGTVISWFLLKRLNLVRR